MFTATELQIKAAYVLWLIDNDCVTTARSELIAMAADRPTGIVPAMTREVFD